jgi:hypothetical protein
MISEESRSKYDLISYTIALSFLHDMLASAVYRLENRLDAPSKIFNLGYST